jgi:hypothetical protein
VQRMPMMLLITAAAMWGGVISADADDARGKIWVPLAVAAAAFTVAGLQQLATLRLARAYEALNYAVLSRPLNRSDTGPLPAVVIPLPAPAREMPHGRLSVPGKRPARHASR